MRNPGQAQSGRKGVKFLAERKLFNKKTDAAVIGLLLLAAAGFALFYWLRPQGDNPTAVISVDGAVVREIDLTKAADGRFSLTDRPVSFEISEHRIRFVDVDCPDHICENTGFVSRPGESAVCMPNKTALQIRAGAAGQ